MIDKLEHLTMAQFIDLACGDTSVLLPHHELASPGKVAKTSRRIFYEYRQIVDEAGVKSDIASAKNETRAKSAILIFKMCRNLIALGEYGRVREIMSVLGIKVKSMSDQRINAEVTSRLERAKRIVAKVETKDPTKESDVSMIRKSFDEQTAALMAHFKFQIDISTMKANLYAHLVSRFNREIKAQQAAMKKK